MDQRGNRRGTFHCIGQPNVERDLCRFTTSTGEQHQANRSQQTWPVFDPQLRNRREYLVEIKGFEVLNEQKKSDQKPEVADAVDDERLFPCGCRGVARKEKSD